MVVRVEGRVVVRVEGEDGIHAIAMSSAVYRVVSSGGVSSASRYS